MELPNLHTHPVARSHPPTAVRKGHPVRLARDGSAALTKLPDLLHLRDRQLDPSLWIVQERFRFLLIERCGFWPDPARAS